MKKIILVTLLAINFCFSQEIYTSKNGKIFENGKRINGEYIQTAFGQNKEILNLYRAGKTKQTIGNILFYGGFATLAIKHLSVINKSKNTEVTMNGPYSMQVKQEEWTNTMYYVSFGMIATSIPVKLGYSKKIKSATSLMNDEIKKQKTNESLNIIYNQNGVGVSLQF